MVLVAGPQGGAGASVQRGDGPGVHRARMVRRGPPDAGLAAEDGSWRVDIARGRDARKHMRGFRVPGGGGTGCGPVCHDGKDGQSQARDGTGRVRQTPRTVRGLPGSAVGRFADADMSDTGGMAVNGPVRVRVRRNSGCRIARCRRREHGHGQPGDEHQDEQPCETPDTRENHRLRIQSAEG